MEDEAAKEELPKFDFSAPLGVMKPQKVQVSLTGADILALAFLAGVCYAILVMKVYK